MGWSHLLQPVDTALQSASERTQKPTTLNRNIRVNILFLFIIKWYTEYSKNKNKDTPTMNMHENTLELKTERAVA